MRPIVTVVRTYSEFLSALIRRVLRALPASSLRPAPLAGGGGGGG